MAVLKDDRFAFVTLADSQLFTRCLLGIGRTALVDAIITTSWSPKYSTASATSGLIQFVVIAYSCTFQKTKPPLLRYFRLCLRQDCVNQNGSYDGCFESMSKSFLICILFPSNSFCPRIHLVICNAWLSESPIQSSATRSTSHSV